MVSLRCTLVLSAVLVKGPCGFQETLASGPFTHHGLLSAERALTVRGIQRFMRAASLLHELQKWREYPTQDLQAGQYETVTSLESPHYNVIIMISL